MKWSIVLWTSCLEIKIFTVIVISKDVNSVNKEVEEFGFVQVNSWDK